MKKEAVRLDVLSPKGLLPALHPPEGTSSTQYTKYTDHVLHRSHMCSAGQFWLAPMGTTYSKPIHHSVNQLKFILIGPFHQTVRSHHNIQWVTKTILKHRAMCGLTSAGHSS